LERRKVGEGSGWVHGKVATGDPDVKDLEDVIILPGR
jgi:hypothetical protein